MFCAPPEIQPARVLENWPSQKWKSADTPPHYRGCTGVSANGRWPDQITTDPKAGAFDADCRAFEAGLNGRNPSLCGR